MASPNIGHVNEWHPNAALTPDDAGKQAIVWNMIEQTPATWTGKAWMAAGRVLRDVAFWRPLDEGQGND